MPAEVLAEYKRARAREPGIRQLELRGLAGISAVDQGAGLDLLDFAVAPSLRVEPREHDGRWVALLHDLDAPDLDVSRRQALEAELSRLEHERWDHSGARDDRRRADPVSLARVLHAYRRFTVIGDPGAGKSVLTRLAFLACTDGREGERARRLLCDDDGFSPDAVNAVRSLRGLLPVRLALGRLGETLAAEGEVSIEKLIRRQLRASRAPAELLDGLRGLLDAGRVFLLCDGLDEVPEKHRSRVVGGLESLLERYPDVRLLLTSRPHGYRPRVAGLSHTWLAPLHPRQQRVLVTRLHQLVETRRGTDARSTANARRRTAALLRAIQPQREWSSLGSNPLLLTLSALTPTLEDGSPRHRVFVFENFLRALLGEWRSSMGVTSAETERLLEAWAAVASELVRSEERGGVAQARLIRLLEDVLGEEAAASPLDAKSALHLALETGLVQRDDEMVRFWHSTFAEYLAARAITGNGRGAAKRILAEEQLPPLVLKLAAARLDHVLRAREEVELLTEGLLARDAHGEAQLLRPGLRAVSACLTDGVRFGSALTRRIWTAWARLLERTPPSLLWGDFGELATRAPVPRLPGVLVKLLARILDLGVSEVREGLARVVSQSDSVAPVVREACERWLKQSSNATARLHGAYGLASRGDWSPRVIDVLGSLASENVLAPEEVARLVRGGGARLSAELRRLVKLRFPSELPPSAPGQPLPTATPKQEQESEHVLRARRLSAACLLAITGAWEGDVAQVLRMKLTETLGDHGNPAMFVVRHCAVRKPVQASLLEWLQAGSTLGHNARELIRDVAPIVDGLAEAVLERTDGAESGLLETLEDLLAAIGEERRTLANTLRRWLEEKSESRRLSAVRILHRLEPGDDRIREALREGMRAEDAAERARWARQALALGVSGEVAMETLQDCARSPELAVRRIVYDDLPRWLWPLTPERLSGWIACAEDPRVPPAARHDAAQLAAYSQGLHERANAVMRQLLDADDSSVRRRSAHFLLMRDELDERAVVVAAEEEARALGTHPQEWDAWVLRKAKPHATVVVQAVLRGLPREALQKGTGDESPTVMGWASVLGELSADQPECVEELLRALGLPGVAGQIAASALLSLTWKHASAREAVRAHLQRTEVTGLALKRLVDLGLGSDETHPEAIVASRRLDPSRMTLAETEFLARRLHGAGAEREAAGLWLRVLGGEDLDLVVMAAQALVVHFPEEVRARVPDVVGRLLASESLSHRVEAARIALRCGLLEEEALAALHGCLDVPGKVHTEARSEPRPWRHFESIELSEGPHEATRIHELRLFLARADFEAMHALMSWRPAAGLSRLVAWLDDEDRERATVAVELLAKEDRYRDAVRTALEARLRTVEPRRLFHEVRLVEQHGFYSRHMAEILMARYQHRPDGFDGVSEGLLRWLRADPELWSVVRSQEPGKRAMLGWLLETSVPVTRDAVALAVERAFAHAGTFEQLAPVNAIQSWCKPASEGSRGLVEERSESPRPDPEEARAWLREALGGTDVPDDPIALALFDWLGTLAELPAKERIAMSRRALAIDVASLNTTEAERTYCFELQARAALRLLELGGRDERIQPILEAAVYSLANSSAHWTFECATVLLKMRRPTRELRDALRRAATVAEDHPKLGKVLEVLEHVGLSREERIATLVARLNAEVRPSWLTYRRRTPEEVLQHIQEASGHRRNEVFPVLDALEVLGCGKARRATILQEFLSAHGAKLSIPTRLTLAERTELPRRLSARLLLSVIADGDWPTHDGTRKWLERFASRRPGASEEEQLSHWDYYREETYLSLRLRAVKRLSKVDEPALMESVLAELVAPSGEEAFLLLYRRARSGARLTPGQWEKLQASLTRTADDDRTTVLAREWLTLGLWQKLEPTTVQTLLRS